MTSSASEQMADGAPAGLWRLVAAPGTEPEPKHAAITLWAQRLAELTGPALAAHILGEAQESAGYSFLPEERVRHARLLNRQARARQLDLLAELKMAGFSPLVMKGLASAYLLYADPDCRVLPGGDLDLLVAEAEWRDLLAHLTAQGWRFAGPRSAPWGFQETASSPPLISPDGALNVDLHWAPDSYPIDRALGVEEVFAASRIYDTASTGLRLPSLRHHQLLLLSNLAKDKFGPFGAKKLVDILVLAKRRELNWEQLQSDAARAGLAPASQALFHLLAAMGLEEAEQHCAPLVSLRASEVVRTIAAWRDLFTRPPGIIEGLRRELLICGVPRIALVRNGRRLAGVFRPRKDGESIAQEAQRRALTASPRP